MALLADYILDLALSELDTATTTLYITSAEATTYAEASSTYALGNKSGLSIGAPADRTPNGRKVTVAAITDGTVTGTDTATHWAITKSGTTLMATGAPTVGSPTLAESSNTDALTADGISTGAPTVGTPALGIVSEIVVQPATGGWEWLNSLNPPSRRQEEPEEQKPRPKKRKRLKAETIELEPDPVIERGIVQTVPAWDAMARLQQMQAEAEIARAQRLRAIALADDDWLMMA